MKRQDFDQADLETTIRRVRAGVRNVMSRMPGKRPSWVVVDLTGSYPARPLRRLRFQLPLDLAGQRSHSLDELGEELAALGRASWLRGVVFRVEELHVDLATAYALRRLIQALKRAGKQTISYVTQVGWTSYYVASAAHEVVAPEGADVHPLGIGVEITFLRDALARFGIRFERLAIAEYKNGFDTFVRQDMSAPMREQYEALFGSLEQHAVRELAEDRGVAPEVVRAFVDEGVSSAARARELRMLTRVAYEDEVIQPDYMSLRAAQRFLAVPASSGVKRIAFVSIHGAIVPGRSRTSPVPVPLFGGAFAGSETITRALRAAEADPQTAAVVIHVDSPGGSTLASDLIWREVDRLRRKKPVVAVMGATAASGGYYVLTHASKVIAAPTTVTGSIGVLVGKLVLEDFYARHGINPERVQRGRFALLLSPSRGFDEAELSMLQKMSDDVYQRFVGRVAEGRRLERDRVDEIGRGHIWSGEDALRIGLVDELGDAQTGIERACELARIPLDSPVWTVRAPSRVLLPSASDPTTLGRALAPLLRERVLLFSELAAAVR